MGTLWITGSTGFIARHLASHVAGLSSRPRLVGLSRRASGSLHLDASHVVDLSDTEQLIKLAQSDRPTLVCHLAGTLPPALPEELALNHPLVTVSLLVALSRAGLVGTRVLSIGSAAEYLPPFHESLSERHPAGGLTPYGQSKAAQSTVALSLGAQLGLPCTVARPFNLVGPGMSRRLVLGSLAEQFANPQGELLVGNLESARDFVDVRDASAALWGLLQSGMPGEVYNVCSGRPTTVRTLIELLGETSGRELPIRVDPERLRRLDPPVVIGNPCKLEALLGWRPQVPLRQSIADLLGAFTERMI